MWVFPVLVAGFFGVCAFVSGSMLALVRVSDHGLGYSAGLLAAVLLVVVGAASMWLAVKMTPPGTLGRKA
jgi:hypothetical protein